MLYLAVFVGMYLLTIFLNVYFRQPPTRAQRPQERSDRDRRALTKRRDGINEFGELE